MTDPSQLDERLEERLAGLIGGHLPPAEAQEVLSLVAHDDHVRRRLGEMLSLQAAMRQAYGYDQAEPHLEKSLAALLVTLKQTPSVGAKPPTAPRPRTIRRFMRRLVLGLSSAAAITMIAVSLYLAQQARQEAHQAQARLDQLFGSTAIPRITETERQQYRRIWSEVADGGDSPEPWIMLSNGGGRFGYLPASPAKSPDERLILVRCFVVSASAERVESVSLLVPARPGLRLSLPEVGQLLGQPLACEITTDARNAGVSLTVKGNSADGTAVAGRVGYGDQGAEIGQFNLHGEPLRVFVQALPLGSAAG
jgi:hypothetical protein